MTDRSPTAWTLAVDFGTSFTVAAVRSDGRPPEAIEIAGERRMPTVVLVEDDGSVLVGRVADDLAASSPGRALRAPKRRLGEPAPVVLGGRAYQVVDLVAAVLRHVYDEAVRHQGSPPDSVRLTHPATWSRPRLARLLEAAAKAGLPQAVLIAEPVAAALSYASEVGVPDGAHVAVYDLGGGTFDTTVLEAKGQTFTVVGRPGGDANLGGELFDELLYNHVGERLDPDTWEELQVSDDVRWRQAAGALRAEVRRAKEALTSAPYAELLVPLPTGLVNLRLTRDELEEVVGPYIDESVRLLLQSVRDAGVDPAALAAVYLVGGASRMPMVERRLSAAVPGVPVSRRGDPKTAVALGATRAEPSGSVLDLQAAGGRTTLESDGGIPANPLLAPPPGTPSAVPPPPPPGSFGSPAGPASAAGPSVSPTGPASAPVPPPPPPVPDALTATSAATAVESTVFDPGTVVDGGTVVERGTVVDAPAASRFPPPSAPAGAPAASGPGPASPARKKGPVLAAVGVVAALAVGGIGFALTRGGDGDTAAPTVTTSAPPVTAGGGAPATLAPLTPPSSAGGGSPTTAETSGSGTTAPPVADTSPTTAAPTTPAPTPAPTAPPVPPGLAQEQLNGVLLSLDEVAAGTGITGWVAEEFVPGSDLCGIASPPPVGEAHAVATWTDGAANATSVTSSSFTYGTIEDLNQNYEDLLRAARECPVPTTVDGGITFTLTFNPPIEAPVPLTDRAAVFVMTATAPNGLSVRSIVGVVTKGRSAVVLGYQVLIRNLQQSDLDAAENLLTAVALKLVATIA